MRLKSVRSVRLYILQNEIGFYPPNAECHKVHYATEKYAKKALDLFALIKRDGKRVPITHYPCGDHWHVSSWEISESNGHKKPREFALSYSTRKRHRKREELGIPPSRARNAQRKRSQRRRAMNKLCCILGI